MKRQLSMSVVIGLLGLSVVTASPALAAERVVEHHYDAPAVGSSDAGGGCAGEPPEAASGCMSIPTSSVETTISIEIVDDGGTPVAASVSWDTDADGISDTGFEMCGKTDTPKPIQPGADVNVFLWAAPSTTCPDGHATTGDVTATVFSLGAGGGGGATIGAKPRATLGFNTLTPEKGSTVKAKAGLRECNAKTRGTKIQLQKKVSGTFKTIKTQKLNNSCKTVFKIVAKFKKATFRSYWKSQHKAYRSGGSPEKTVVTH